MSKTQIVDKSNFDNKQYKTDLQSAYDCGFVKGAIAELEKIKAEIIENQYITCGLTCIPYGDCKYFDCIEVKEVIECLELIEKHITELKGENNPDCRNCDKWKTCENGEKGHTNGTSIGYSIGECKDYGELKGENK